MTRIGRGATKTSWCRRDTVTRGVPEGEPSAFPWNLGGSTSYATALSKFSQQNTDPQQSTGVCPKREGEKKNQGSRKRKRILSSSSVVAKGTRSASLCCDWIIILLLIRAVCVFFSVDSSQRGRELCAIQQDQINPMKASQRSPRERVGGRASRQIQGDATATGCAGQSHMAPGQTGGKAITYSLMSHPPPLVPVSPPLEIIAAAKEEGGHKKKGIRSES